MEIVNEFLQVLNFPFGKVMSDFLVLVYAMQTLCIQYAVMNVTERRFFDRRS